VEELSTARGMLMNNATLELLRRSDHEFGWAKSHPSRMSEKRLPALEAFAGSKNATLHVVLVN
jgi:hypothetical protein